MTVKQLEYIKRRCYWPYPNVDMTNWNESKLSSQEASTLIQTLMDMETWRGLSNEEPYGIIKERAQKYIDKLSA